MTAAEEQGSESTGADEIKNLLARVEALERNAITNDGSTEYADGEADEKKEVSAAADEEQDFFELPESTFTFMITHEVFSIPFFTALLSCALALVLLILAFINEYDNGTDDNRFGLPAGVTRPVRIAQFLGITIGVLMETEIPLGLEIIGKGMRQNPQKYQMRCILFSSILRLAVGYLFLSTLFLTVIQESDVLGIFFDVLALEFVESIDDVLFELFKRGFFGRTLKRASESGGEFVTKKSNQQSNFKKWVNRFIRLVYFLNAVVMVVLLAIVMVNQENGDYRCKSFTVQFGDETWEEAWVKLNNGNIEPRLLVYSHFNGAYIEDGKFNDKPRYVEQNKEDGSPFRSTVPAEIVYCDDAEAWVFRHERISTTLDTDDDEKNECDWLLISPETESYDLIEIAEEHEWRMWKGTIEKNYEISISCNECRKPADCNYHGVCADADHKCVCDQGFYGVNCEFARPCKVLQSTKDNLTNLTLSKDLKDENVDFVETYRRPTYLARNLAGKPYGLLRYGYPDDDDAYYNVFYDSAVTDGSELVSHKHFHAEAFADDDFFQVNNETSSFQELLKNYTFVLWYSGRRWYGQLKSPTRSAETFEEEEFHAFWADSFSGVGSEDNETLIISEPSTQGSPEGLEFFEMRRRNLPGVEEEGYGPFGVLVPIVDAEGASLFRCVEQGD